MSDDSIQEVPVPNEVVKPPVATKSISVTQTLPEGTVITNSVTVSLPTNFEKEVVEALVKTSNVAIDSSQEGKDWVEVTKQAITHNSFDGLYRAVCEKGTTLKREIEGISPDGKPTNVRIFGLTVPKDGSKLSGDKAVMYLRNKIGGGGQGRIPLLNSGFWIELRAPSESQIITLQEMFTLIKSEIGRVTYGLAFSAMSSYIYETIWNFIEQENLIMNTSIEVNAESPAINLRELIAEVDLPAIVVGLLHTMYPGGVNYKRACSTDPEKCLHVESGKLALQYLLVFDDSKLNQTQIQHISKKIRQSVKPDEIKQYQEQLPNNQKRKIIINYNQDNPDEYLTITLKRPNLHEYFTNSHQWITGLTETAEKVLADQSDRDKKESIANRAKATRLRQYRHYIESIEIEDVELDKEKIVDYLEVFSEQDDIFDKVIDEIKKFIENGSISFIAVDKYKCSKCGNEQDEGHQTYIPLDALQLFFDMHHQRVRRIISGR